MNVYTCTDFKGHWPVGVAAVIIANDEDDAVTILQRKLAASGLKQDVSPESIKKVDLRWAEAFILNDGDY